MKTTGLEAKKTAVDAVARCVYNVNMRDFKAALFPDEAEPYVQAKFTKMQENFGLFFCELDLSHQREFVRFSLARQLA